MSQNTKSSVSVALRSTGADGGELVVAVLRPLADDDPLGGLWGLPAATLRNGETTDDAVSRVFRDKLGLQPVPAESLSSINEGKHNDGQFSQSMTVYATEWDKRAHLPISLPRPAPAAQESVTLYEAWRWAAPDELREAARRGSLCTRLYLEWLEASKPGST